MQFRKFSKLFPALIFIFLFIYGTRTLYAEDIMENKIQFQADDGVTITADIYMNHDKAAPFIVLFHQAGSSRGEYNEIAPRLNKLGFNAMAIDQRSGSSSNGKSNETNSSARTLGKNTKYMDAAEDLTAAFNYAKNNYAEGKILVWGSSYSASLVLLLSGRNQINPDGILSFSPGEYLGFRNKVASAVKSINVPVFITSAKNEKNSWWKIFRSIPSENKTYFIPESKNGRHGSSTLFSTEEASGDYWAAVEKFLKQFN